MRKIKFAEKEFYHIYNRGVDRRIVFVSKEDYDRFESYLYLLNDSESPRVSNVFRADRSVEIYKSARAEQHVAIGAYCLMPNHFHILATPLSAEGISKFMQKLTTAYTMYFNEKYERSGSLFQGTFKARHVRKDTHLKYLFAYIHLNPAKLFSEDWKNAAPLQLESLAKKIMDYRYSSIGEYLSSIPKITMPDRFPKYFKKARAMETYIRFWLKHKTAEVI